MSTATPVASAAPTVQPDFLGMVRGELLKMSRQRPIIAMAIIIGAFLFVYELRLAFFVANFSNIAEAVNASPSYFATMYGLSDVRGLTGIFITIVAAIVIALEYQQGTIRVLLSRGVGRLQLLGAKLTAIMIVGFLAYIASLIIMELGLFLAFGLAGQGGYLSQIPDYFWSDVATFALTVLVSIVITALIAATLAVIGRSLAFGLGLGLPFFIALDYILTPILVAIGTATQNDFWSSIPRFFPGINLLELPSLLIPNRGSDTALVAGFVKSTGNLVTTDTTKAILVLLAYAVGCLVLSGWLVKSRDVLQ